ncbi:hypothetical protein BCV72DRAFT_305474 [Rhizopus microsporus var. microsporus]|uniref:Uncharacterized protein n=1 Tax=Rhizopus microsporus var. microsporus TaxID=86635 RepID=A0A1X0R3C8_RHIZD|nr:hypothetical protein BCV72DRAFT_305474 [Rhizopus microsporus var. microsporus]
MPFVTPLKEAFAIAPISDREDVLKRYSGSVHPDEVHYFQGLVILQKIHDEAMKQKDPLAIRSPTDVEKTLMDQMTEKLKKFPFNSTRYNELNTRFRLLTYPINVLESTEFIKMELGLELDLTTKQPEQSQQQGHQTEEPVTRKLPSKLDPSLINTENLLKAELSKHENMQIKSQAIPVVVSLMEKENNLTKEQKARLFDMILRYPTEDYPSFMNVLIDFWSDKQSEWQPIAMRYDNFTLKQLNEIAERMPDILWEKKYVQAYLKRLAPYAYYHRSASDWDDDEDILLNYLDQAAEFVNKLPNLFFKLKSAVLFHRLRIDVVRQTCDQDKLVEYLDVRNMKLEETRSPIPSRFQKSSPQQTSFDVALPLFEYVEISTEDHYNLLEAYFTVLVAQNKLTYATELYASHDDYDRISKMLAKIKLTVIPDSHDYTEECIKILGAYEYDALTQKTLLSFSPSTCFRSVKRRPQDSIVMHVNAKNIPRLSIRVFQIDTENYWRSHVKTDNEAFLFDKINLDGLCPNWEKDIDIDQKSSLLITQHEVIFGNDGLAPEIFNGRGLWVIEFVGGDCQCRAIVQKGYLKHISQDIVGGHLIKVMDEDGNFINKAKIWFNNQFYEADESDNILIPYLTMNKSPIVGQMTLISTEDGFSEPAEFSQAVETYNLKATFYINREMVSFNKKATIAVIPKLTMNDQPYSAFESASLNIECWNANDIKTTTSKVVTSLDKPSLFDFTVPEQFQRIQATLEVKVKALDDTVTTVSETYEQYFSYNEALPINILLRKTVDDQYCIYVLGANGEPKHGKEIYLEFKHKFVAMTVSVSLQADEEGKILLGDLSDIESVKCGESIWHVLSKDFIYALPESICVEANKPFKIVGEDVSIYRVGYHNCLLESYDKLKKENGYVTISGLAEGEYKIYTDCSKERSISCSVAQSVSKPNDRLWSNWVVGKRSSIRENGIALQRPLLVSSVTHDTDNISLQLENWSSNTFAIVTTNAFVPQLSYGLQDADLDIKNSKPLIQHDRSLKTRSIFLQGMQIGEEYQYILNRKKLKKWVGSNLTHPSLLINPKEHSSTTSSSRELQQARKQFTECQFQMASENIAERDCVRAMYRGCSDSFTPENKNPLAFLDNVSPLLFVPVDPSSGTIRIKRDLVSCGGATIEYAIISGDQAVYKQVKLPQDVDLKFRDIRQNDSLCLVQSKTFSTLAPAESITLDTRDYVTVASVDDIFTIIKSISSEGDLFCQTFGFLNKWPTYSFKEKSKFYSDHVCHELNVWLKRKDIGFFNKVVRPSIKSKVEKSFIDLYLLEHDLSMYSQNMYLFSKLNTAEKALLATTQSQEFLQSVIKIFKDSIDERQQVDRADKIYEKILAAAQTDENFDPMDEDDENDDIGYADMSYAADPYVNAIVSPCYSASAPVAFGSAASSSARSAMRQALSIKQHREEVIAEQTSSNGPVDEGLDPELAKMREELRMKSKELQAQKKVKYEFVKPTTEWIEAGYYEANAPLNVKQFWIDYLESKGSFLSTNFVYCLDHTTEMLWVLALMDLPFNSQRAELLSQTGKEVTIQAENTFGLMVLYRQLKEVADETQLDSLVIHQEFFVYEHSVSPDSDECIKVDPHKMSLEPQTEYGCHLIISNISSAPVQCEVSYQAPTGSVPVQFMGYRCSKSVYIMPYSTWRAVVGTFYFPAAGKFATAPITALVKRQAQSFVTKTTTAELNVINRNVNSNDNTSAANTLFWPTTAFHGTNAEVLSFLSSHKRLEKLDLSLINWRMTDANFARQVFDILSRTRCFYSRDLWKYALYHRFTDAIKDLLLFQYDELLRKSGQIFECPLVSVNDPYATIYDYFPLVNARAHPLQPSKHEVLNQEFYQKYNKFLDYLCERSSSPSTTDLIILTHYLILQNRIGDAHTVFSRIDLEQAEKHHAIQVDYLNAYLKTRIPITDNHSLIELDLASIKEILEKYRDFGIERWRIMFDELREFVREIEQGTSTQSSSLTASVQSHPILEFTIDSSSNELVIQHANIKSANIRYYEMNIEVMFSSNPFMNDAVEHDSFKWVKPLLTETIELNSQSTECQEGNDDDGDFDMIGAGQIQAIQTSRVSLKSGSKNVLIEVTADSFTDNAVTTTNRIQRSSAYYANSLNVHVAESFGIVRVMCNKTKRPLAGAYVKVYARLREFKHAKFWKDGYTGLNGVFDYISVTEGNALVGNYEKDLKALFENKIDKLSILIMSDEGAVVKEVYPPLT